MNASSSSPSRSSCCSPPSCSSAPRAAATPARPSGRCRRETVKRDRVGAPRRSPPKPAATGRRGRGLDGARAPRRRRPPSRRRPTTAPVPWTPPDPETIGVTRRQFLNRSIVGVSASASPASAPASSGSCGRRVLGRLRLEDPRRQDRPTSSQKISDGSGFAYYPEGRMWITRTRRRRSTRPGSVYSAVGARRHGGRGRRPVPEVRAPRLPRARSA